MDSPAGRSARTPGSVKLTAAAVSIALMATAGVALAAPKTDPGSPQQAQENGPPPQAQDNGPAPQAQQNAPPPQAQRPASPPAGAKANGRQSAGKPGAVPAAQPPQAGGNGSGAGQSGAAHHGRPAPGEARGQGRSHSSRARSGVCRMGGCRGAASDAGAGPAGAAEQPQPQPAGGRRNAADDDPRHTPDEGTDHGQAEAAPGSGGAVQGLDQGGGDDVYLPRGSFDGALPFTGFEFALLAAIGALLGFAGMWLRRSSSAA